MYEERLRWPVGIWLGIAMICVLPVVIILFAVQTASANASPQGPLLSALIFDMLVVACLVAFFGTLRITLDQTVLTVGFGPFRERIFLDQIVGCRVTPYRWTEWGGWGIRFQRHAKMYNVAGDGGVAVEITLDGGRRVLFSSRHPEAVCAALHAARPEIA